MADVANTKITFRPRLFSKIKISTTSDNKIGKVNVGAEVRKLELIQCM